MACLEYRQLNCLRYRVPPRAPHQEVQQAACYPQNLVELVVASRRSLVQIPVAAEYWAVVAVAVVVVAVWELAPSAREHPIDMSDTIVVVGTRNANNADGRYDCMEVSCRWP